VKSRRLRIGRTVRLLNGKGLIALGQIESAEKKTLRIKLSRFEQHDKPVRAITIAVAVPKGDRQKVMLDMLTQLGCAKIVPILYEYSVTKFSENMRQKWQRLLIEFCKQSQNPWLPEIANAIDIEKFLERNAQNTVFADANGTELCNFIANDSLTTVLVGPEGGFSRREHDLFTANKVQSVRLGPHILRTEAAAIAATVQWVALRSP